MRKQGGNIATFFCTPEGEVLNMRLGPVASTSLIGAGQNSLELSRRLTDCTGRERAACAREFHAAFPSEQALHFLGRLLHAGSAFSCQNDSEHNPATEADADALARATLCTAIEIERSADPETQLRRHFDEEILATADVVAPQFRTFGTFDRHTEWLDFNGRYLPSDWNESQHDPLLFLEHAFLAHAPLINLRDLEKPVCQIFVGERFFERTANHDATLERYQSAVASGKQILLVLEPGRVNSISTEDWLSEGRLSRFGDIASQLHRFEVIQLSRDDLFVLQNDLGLPPFKQETRRRRIVIPSYFFLDRNGEVLQTLTVESGADEIASAMRSLGG